MLPPGESVCQPLMELDVDIPSAIVLPLRHGRCLLLPGFQFLVPVTVTMQYNDSDVAGLDERTLEFLYWNGTEWSSDGITVIERDTINNRITVSVTHLTEFALFARPIHVYLPIVQRNSAS